MEPQRVQFAVEPRDTFDGTVLRTSYDEVTEERVTGSLTITETLRAPHGAVALGVFTSVAEGAASMGTAMAAYPAGNAASGLANDTTMTREVREGTITFAAVPRDRAPDLWTWEVVFHDAAGDVCALTKVLIAVRPLR